MDDQISSIQMLSDFINDETQGCYNVEQEIFLIENNGVIMQQISQWLIVVILPITTVIFITSGVQAWRTHGCSFDSIVLFLCAIYNLIYMFEDLIKCSRCKRQLGVRGKSAEAKAEDKVFIIDSTNVKFRYKTFI